MAAQIMARSAVPKKCFKHWSISHLSGPKIYHESGNDALHEFLSRATCVDATLLIPCNPLKNPEWARWFDAKNCSVWSVFPALAISRLVPSETETFARGERFR